MKKISKYKLTVLLLLLFRLSFGQLPDIVEMEYYFDTDPGYGNAISVPITADSLINTNFDADLSGISSGFHILYVRIKDAIGNWSIALTQGFLKFPEPISISTPVELPQITQMEYFFDFDPGFGNGINVPVTSDSLVDIAFNADLSNEKSGFHVLYVRTKDDIGNWSIALTQGFLKFPEPISISTPVELPQITQMEYFFDFDPGFGNGTNVPVTSDSLVDIAFNADLSNEKSGFHILYVRTKDDIGNWSIALTQGFLKFPEPISISTPVELPQITQMEYFFDFDPGFGNGTNVPVTSDSLVDIAFNADLSNEKSGFHFLYVRTKDEFGNWSIALTQGFLKLPEPISIATAGELPQVTHMEYFIDSDPGFGNGVPVAITSDSLVEIAFDVDFGLLDNGTHNLYIRVLDENGAWSLLYSNPFFKFIPPATSDPELLPDIVSMEYFFDNDPGFGNGTEILNTPDSMIVRSFISDISMLGPEKHIIYTRVKDANNRWSLSVMDYFCLQGLQVFLEGPYDSISGFMSTILNDNGLLPLSQPFDSDPAAVWYYNGNENVGAIPNTNIVDWLLLQARDTTSAANATSATIKENQVAFLLNDGNIVGLDGESYISFTEPIVNDLYLVVFQRNHLGVMSAFPLNVGVDCDFTYSFSLGPNQVYGNENGHKEIGSGVWGMISSDGDGNGQVDNDDKTLVWKLESGNAAYLSGDFNMDGQVDNSDKNILWILNQGSGSDIPE